MSRAVVAFAIAAALGCSGKKRDFSSAPAELDANQAGESAERGGGAAADSPPEAEDDGAGPMRREESSELGGGGTVALLPADAGTTGSSEPTVLTSEIDQIDLGSAEEGTLGNSFTWVVTNTGLTNTGPLTLAQQNADFLISNGCTASLAPGGSCRIEVTFAPQTGGLKSLTLMLGDSLSSASLLAIGNARVRLTLTKLGTGTITSDQGLNCGETCSALVDLGARVTLQATTSNGSNAFFSGWSLSECEGAGRTCTFTVVGRQTIAATFTPSLNNLVFFSSEAFTANLGDLAAYDSACNRLATAAGINDTQGSGYLAMMSDTATTARERFSAGVQGWVRLDGKPFTTTLTDLFDASVIYHPAGLDEYGDAPPANPELRIMTGTEGDGTSRTTCNDWTTLDPTVEYTWGVRFGGPITWTFFGDQSCAAPAHIICMGNTRSTPLQITRTSGQRIWATQPTYTVGAGVTPDARCFAERPDGVASARALIAYPDRTAGEVLDPNANYVRLDGLLVGTGQQLLDRQVLTGIWQGADGSYLAPEARTIIVPTGAARLTELGTPETTCDGWTNPSGTKIFGAFALSNSNWWFRDVGRECDEPVSLYCVEQ
jgi:hypothetical protein